MTNLNNAPSVLDDLAEDLREMAVTVKLAYKEWPEDHRMHAHLPGLIASAMHDGIQDKDFARQETPDVVGRLYELAGLAGHPHIAEVVYIVGEMLDLR